MTEHKRPIFGANGAVLNSDTMSESLRDEYEIESNRSLKGIAASYGLALAGLIAIVYVGERLLNWMSLPTWVFEYGAFFLHVWFFAALLSKRGVISAIGAACLVGLVYVSRGQAQDLTLIRYILVLLTGLVLFWRARAESSQTD